MKIKETVSGQPKDVDLGYPATATPYFNGISDQIDIPYAIDLNPTSFTIEMWVKYQGGSGYRAILTSVNGSASLGRRGYVFCVNSAQQWQFWMGSGMMGFPWAILTGSRSQEGIWTHLAGTYDEKSQTMIFYVNGSVVGQWVGVPFLPNDQNPLHVGAGAIEQPGASSCFFHGSITNVRIWGRSLSAEEIQTSSSLSPEDQETHVMVITPEVIITPSSQDLQPDATQTQEETTRGESQKNNSTFDEDIWEQTEVPLKSVVPILIFNGQDDYVEIPYSAALDFAQDQDFTIEVWLKPDPVQQGEGKATFDINVLEKWTGTPFPYAIRYSSKNDRIYASRYDGKKNPAMTSSQPINDQQLHHIAFVKQSSHLYLYVDGVEVASANDTTIGTTHNNSPLYLCRGAGGRNFYKGQVSEFRIWNRSRSQAEIQADMSRCLVGNEPGLVGYWPLNEGTGSVVKDHTVNANHGKIHGATWQQVEILNSENFYIGY
ncbi:LamG domain-containing protein [Iningainema tapete]|uniref:LamG domain-containing protein n=1 Tax=Iningainema tapete BLCC-T55 TaxID=2748662 RepID=A0A8J6XKB0_9CYAN|nr:LamG domain-containing protein [Iningainema tapete]MBD2773089.1 LamG domain-containing protein [Iningainema tapete BLCC-T55]